MLDIKLIRQDPDAIKEKLHKREGQNYDDKIDSLLSIDADRRELTARTDSLRAKQNSVSKEIPKLKKQGEDVSSVLAEMKELSEEIKKLDADLKTLNDKQHEILLSIPNTPHDSVVSGPDDSCNVEQRRWGTPRKFDFEYKPHWELGKSLNILDPERAAKVTGTRFHFYRGLGAKLERAVVNFYLDLHTEEHGYLELLPPFIANGDSMTGTGQLPKFAEDMYKLEGLDYYLVPTAEVPVTNYRRAEVLDESELPVKYVAYTPCFRGEAGSAGRDTAGIIRQHQFNKVELVKLAYPDTSYDELEKLTHDAEDALQRLGLPYRVVALCGGDLGFSAAKTYDIEVWMPSYDRYVEISSCSDYEDYQARRMDIKFRDSKTGKLRLVHTLNGSGLAVGRTTAAIMENYQNEDGSITVPDVLVPYMHGVKVIRGDTLSSAE
ncbi:MAG: serine--tRNA ligase [Oscillospiraceae bacterium]|jgi:seryl-tRNA synthetase